MKDYELAINGGQPVLNYNIDYKWPVLTEEDKQYVIKVLERGDMSFNQNSEEIYKLENHFKEYIKSDYCLALNSGTSALHLALLAIGIKPGDEVLVPTYTFAATVMPLLHLGAKIVFIDSEKYSSKINIIDLKAKISTMTKAIILTHMDGIANDCEYISSLAKENNFWLIEDCAQALGARYNGKSVGTWGDIGIFSFQQKKVVAAGEGGMLVTSNREIYEKSILYSHLQARSYLEVKDDNYSQFNSTGLGFNFRMHPLIAALALTQIKKIDENILKRRKAITSLADELNKYNCLLIPQTKIDEEQCSYYTLRIYFHSTPSITINQFVAALQGEGVPIVLSTTLPLHLEPIFDKINTKIFFPYYKNNQNLIIAENLDNSEEYSQYIMRMPPFSKLNKKENQDILKAFAKVIHYYGLT